MKLNVSSDDDTLVYLNGLYVGGNPGVHGETSTILDLGAWTGPASLEIFYADRAQVAAVLNLGVTGAAIPELSTWGMMALGFAGLGLAGHRARKTVRLAV